jgi:NAD(P) transhydrogenase subunit alpha
MKLGIVKEIRRDEHRIAVAPGVAGRLVKAGWEVLVECGAGAQASYSDEEYRSAGAVLLPEAEQVWQQADVIAKIRPPTLDEDGICEVDWLREGGTLICFVFPGQYPHLVERLAARRATVLAIDCIPRISRAQKVDALSSMANIAGYRAVIEAATRFGNFFTGQITAAGKVPPAKVLVIGAGVAGLAAIAAAKGMGAIVRAFDVRASVAEEVKSLGGEFLTVDLRESGEGGGGYAREMSAQFIEAEQALFRQQAREVNIVICAALVPGRRAPRLWLRDMVEMMKPGSVIVDLAAENGGNCELTVPGEVSVHNGITIIGYTEMASRMAQVASELFGTNLWYFLEELGGANEFKIDHENDIVRGALVLEQGEKRWPPPAPKKVEPEVKESREGALVVPAAALAAAQPAAHAAAAGAPELGGRVLAGLAAAGTAAYLILRFALADAPASPELQAFLQHLTVFALSVFVGWQVIWSVTPALHTPLMSVTNAISGIIVVGGLLGAGRGGGAATGLAVAAAFFAMINIVGGFWVTRRMLAMFRK